MGNKHRGEVSFEAMGQTWRLRYGTNALCEIEAAFGEGINATLAKLQSDDPSIRTMRTIMACGLGVSGDEAGDIMDEIGMERSGELIGQAMTLAFPQPEANAGNGKAARAN